jgi:DNA-binding response OmpR family regulator
MHKSKILVVDDDLMLLDACSRVLQLADYEVLRAATGEEGLRLAKA